MFFTREAWDRYKLDKAEYALLKKREEEDEKDKAKDTPKTADKGKDKEKEKEKDKPREAAKPDAGKKEQPATPDEPIKLPAPVKVDHDQLEDRVARLTPNSATMRAATVTPNGETLLFVTQTADSYELWSHRLRTRELKRMATLPLNKPERGEPETVELLLDAKGENGFVLSDGVIQKFKLPKEDGDIKPERLRFTAELRLDRAAERAEMFEHAWRQTREKLYVPDMGGVDWADYRRAYARFLPYVNDNQDFAELLSEMLGELNVSHTGASYRARNPGGDSTAALGFFHDEAHFGPGVKIAEIIDGGPLVGARSVARPGMVIEKIDGSAIAPLAEIDSLLNLKAGKRVALGLLDPATGQRHEQVVRAVSLGEQNELLYRRWVKKQRAMVDKLSGGRLGYVHVRGMDDDSYRDVFSEVLGRHSAKEALIVDTRFNGGGNLHDELSTLLSGRRYLEFVPRGQSLGHESTGRWTKPSLVLVSESNYSDAHLFPWTYRHLGIGKLLGMPVAGTGTAVWWETMQDPTLVFGIPMVGFRDAKGEYMEKALIEPDIRVPNEAAMLKAGRDQQTEAAVQELLKR
jgi:tricorn protease